LGLELALLALFAVTNALIIWYAIVAQMVLAATVFYAVEILLVAVLPAGPAGWLPLAALVATAIRAGYLLVQRQAEMADR